MLKDVLEWLESKGIETFYPGQHKGTFKKNTVIIKDGGHNRIAGNKNAGYRTIELFIYVPLKKYSEVETFTENVKAAMKGFEDLTFTGLETQTFIDDKREAHFKRIEYSTRKTIN